MGTEYNSGLQKQSKGKERKRGEDGLVIIKFIGYKGKETKVVGGSTTFMNLSSYILKKPWKTIHISPVYLRTRPEQQQQIKGRADWADDIRDDLKPVDDYEIADSFLRSVSTYPLPLAHEVWGY